MGHGGAWSQEERVSGGSPGEKMACHTAFSFERRAEAVQGRGDGSRKEHTQPDEAQEPRCR